MSEFHTLQIPLWPGHYPGQRIGIQITFRRFRDGETGEDQLHADQAIFAISWMRTQVDHRWEKKVLDELAEFRDRASQGES